VRAEEERARAVAGSAQGLESELDQASAPRRGEASARAPSARL
jgi:hypothetical protein